MRIRKSLFVFAATFAVTLAGCATTLPVNYAPSSTMSATGSIAVAPFTYLPATSGQVEANQVRNTALGNIKFEQNVDMLVRDAVFKELRFVGVDVRDQDRKLSGEIQEFLIDDLGYSVDWTLRIRYQLADGSGQPYDSVKEIKRNTNKFANVFGALNETIKLNVEELLKDPAFIQAIQ